MLRDLFSTRDQTSQVELSMQSSEQDLRLLTPHVVWFDWTYGNMSAQLDERKEEEAGVLSKGVGSNPTFSWRRFQVFTKVTTFSQKTSVKVFSNALLYANLVCFIVFYLIETATHREPAGGTIKYVILAINVVSGIQTTATLFVGSPFLFPSRIWWVVLVDFGVWVLLVTTSSLVLTIEHDETGEDDTERTWTAVMGLVLAIRLNTFLAFNQSLSTMDLETRVNLDSGNFVGVPVIVIAKMIAESGMQDDYQRMLQEDLIDADKNGDGVLDSKEFYYFKHASRKRNVHWSMPWFSDRTEYHELLSKLVYHDLLPEEDLAFLENGADEDIGLVDATITSARLLLDSQRFLGLLVVVVLCIGSVSETAFVLVTGKQVNVALELAVNHDHDDAGGNDDSKRQFMGGIAGLVLLWLLNEVSWYVSCVLGARMIANATARIQLELVKCSLYGGREFEENYNGGALSNVFSSNLSKTEQVWHQLIFYFTRPVAALISAVGFLAAFDISYAIFVVTAIPMVASFHFLEVKATYWSDQADESEAQLLSRFQNTIRVRPAAQVFNAQSFLLERFSTLLQPAKRDNFQTFAWSNVVEAAFTTVGGGLNAIATVVFLFELADGHISAGEFFTIAGIVSGIIYPIDDIGAFSGEIAKMSGAVQKVAKVLSDGQQGERKEAIAPVPSQDSPLSLDNQLVLENVSFSCGPNLPFILNDLSLSIPAGSYTCFLGSSGSGKSTLLSLLMANRTCTSGRILMDGIDTSNVPLARLRESLAVVFQETYVLDGTIFDNIAFGGDKTLDTVIDAAIGAGIDAFIESLPEKYDTLLGSEVNTSLSGGQLQRICGIARALARNPKLLIMDEATSSLDKVSERLVIKSIEHLRDNGLTIVSVTHHPATAKNADEIVILDHGRIAQRGHYEMLQSEQGHFANLIKAERRKSLPGMDAATDGSLLACDYDT